MAVEPLPNVFKSFTFDGESSASYGVQIYGERVFNAPTRAVQMVQVPGRNGAVALDQGYWENVEVTYPAVLIADSPTDFAQAMADFRNFLCSRRGYCRLSDDYNPDEYRLAVYKSGLDVTERVLKTGEFNITFDCKPQRYLTSGEEQVNVTSGDVITNPTPFDAQPLIVAVGEGDITIGKETITVLHRDLGDITIDTEKTVSGIGSKRISTDFDGALLNHGDLFQITGFFYNQKVNNVRSIDTYRRSGNLNFDAILSDGRLSVQSSQLNMNYITPGSSSSPTSLDGVTYATVIDTSGGSHDLTITADAQLTEQDGVGTLLITLVVTITGSGVAFGGWTIGYESLSAYSTVAHTGDVYIDLELGEAYYVSGQHLSSLNNIVEIGSNLPVLAPGDTTVTYDSTITSLKIIPRWWIV